MRRVLWASMIGTVAEWYDVLIGWLPTFDQIGIWARLPQIILRFVQGVGGHRDLHRGD